MEPAQRAPNRFLITFIELPNIAANRKSLTVDLWGLGSPPFVIFPCTPVRCSYVGERGCGDRYAQKSCTSPLERSVDLVLLFSSTVQVSETTLYPRFSSSRAPYLIPYVATRPRSKQLRFHVQSQSRQAACCLHTYAFGEAHYKYLLLGCGEIMAVRHRRGSHVFS